MASSSSDRGPKEPEESRGCTERVSEQCGRTIKSDAPQLGRQQLEQGIMTLLAESPG